MDAILFEALKKIEAILAHSTDRDHCCEQDDCTIETPKCDDMNNRAAFRMLERLLDPPHTGLHPRRLRGERADAERIYVQTWQRWNGRGGAGVGSFGSTLLEILLQPETETIGTTAFTRPVPDRVSFRDAEVAATIIQWFGTNVGKAFLDTCESEIKKASAQRSTWDFAAARLMVAPAEQRPFKVQAEMLAGRLFDTDQMKRAAQAIEAALQSAYEIGAAGEKNER